MKKYCEILSGIPLFTGFTCGEVEILLAKFNCKIYKFSKENTILQAGDTADRLGILLEGQALVVNENAEGVRNIVTHLESGDMFAEIFAAAKTNKLPVSVVAEGSCEVVFLNYDRLVKADIRIPTNISYIFAQKSLKLSNKNEILSKRSTEEKLMEYFIQTAPAGKAFETPFTRQQLADYLCVERSAMSSVLARLQKKDRVMVKKSKIVWYK